SRSSTFTVGATITIPLFDGDSRRNKIQEAQAQAEKSELQVTDTENRVLLELVKTHAELAASLDNIDAANQLLQAAQSAMDSATNRYERGVSDILELISAQGTLVDALDARAQCEYQWNAARLKLMSDLGEMNRDSIAALDGPLPTP
ncbi:TolC family protein, partial [Mitsuaria sp. TWR114]